MSLLRSRLPGILALLAMLAWQPSAESAPGVVVPKADAAKRGTGKPAKARPVAARSGRVTPSVKASAARSKTAAPVPRVSRANVSAAASMPASVTLAAAPGAVVPAVIAQALQQEQSVPRHASLRYGCLNPSDAQSIARGKLLDPAALDALLARGGGPWPGASESLREAQNAAGCLPFAALLPPNGGEPMMAVLQAEDSPGSPKAALLSPQGGSLQPLDLMPLRPEWQALELRAGALQSGAHELLDPLPDHLRWQLQLIARRMLADHAGNLATRQFRVVLTRGDDGEFDEIQQVELFDALSGQRLDGVYWIEREAMGGMLAGLRGTPYERLFWQSPVGFERISRGVSRVPLRVIKKAYVRNARTKALRIRTLSVRRAHAGVDFVAPTGTPVQAVANGIVLFAGPRGDYGNLIVLDHGQGVTTYYAHLSAFTEGVEPGRVILRGEVIGQVGSTGFSTGPHLHYEIRKDDRYLDPFDPNLDLDQWVMRAEDRPRVLGKMLALEFSRRQREAERLARADGTNGPERNDATNRPERNRAGAAPASASEAAGGGSDAAAANPANASPLPPPAGDLPGSAVRP